MKPLNWRYLTALFVVAIIAAIGGSAAHAGATITVCSGGSCDYTTIQAAVTAASAGDTINVLSGTYSESVTVNKNLTLDGAQAGVAGNAHSGAESTVSSIHVTSSDVTIDGFKFNRVGSQVLVDTSSGTLSNEVVQNNIFDGYDSVGISTHDAGNILIKQNLFQNPSGSAEPMQIKADSGDPNGCGGSQVEDNTFNAATTNGSADANFSCSGSNSSNVTVSGNTSSNASDPNGASLVALAGIADVSITGNTATTVGSSVLFFGSVSGTATVSGNDLTSSSSKAVSIHGGDNFAGVNDPANTGHFVISNNTLEATSGTAILIVSTGAGTTVNGNIIAAGSISNSSGVGIDAARNYWGSANGPGAVATGVTLTPWCTNSGCSTFSNQDTVYVDPAYTGSSAGGHLLGYNAFTTISGGVAGVNTCGTVNVSAGTFNEQVTGNKCVTLDGANAGIHPTVGTGIGTTDTVGTRGAETILSHNFPAISPNADNITVDGFEFTGTGARLIDTSSDANNFHLTNSIFAGTTAGPTQGVVQFNSGSHTGMLVDYTLFQDAGDSSIYLGTGDYTGFHLAFDKMAGSGNGVFQGSSTPISGAIIEGTEFTGGANGVGLNMGQAGNLIYRNNYCHDEAATCGQIGIGSGAVTDNRFEHNANDALELWGGDFNTFVSSNDTITGNTITYNDNAGTANGIRLRTGADAANIHIHDNTFVNGGVHQTALAVRNQGTGTADATRNYWGSANGPGTITGVNVTPWYLDAGKSALSNNADLASLSLSGATISPAFDPSTTTYTASVDNTVASVTVNQTANLGANAVVSGAASLAVGDNSVQVTVTSADGTVKTYTVTVTRAAAPASGGGGTTTTTTTPAPPATTTTTPTSGTTTSGTATTTVTPTSVAVTQTATNQGATTPVVQPAQSGTASVTVAPTTGSTTASPAVPFQTTWPANTFTVPVTVAVTPQPDLTAPTPDNPNPPAVVGGLAVGHTVIQIVATNSSGQKVTVLDQPLQVHIDSAPGNYVPAFSEDGKTWTTIPRIYGLPLPAGQSDGYFVNTDGSIDVYTRHLTYFGLLKDVQAPSSATLKASLSGNKLRLSIKGAKDNVRVDHYQILLNGKLVKSTTHAYLVLTARAGKFQVIVVDAAGNHGPASKPVTVVRSHPASEKHRFKLKR